MKVVDPHGLLQAIYNLSFTSYLQVIYYMLSTKYLQLSNHRNLLTSGWELLESAWPELRGLSWVRAPDMPGTFPPWFLVGNEGNEGPMYTL